MDSTLVKIISNPSLTFQRDTIIKDRKSKYLNGGEPPHLPDNFDGRRVWGDLLTPALNSGSCGSCWSFCTTGILADRFNILSRGKLNVILSPTRPILCDSDKAGKTLNMDNTVTNMELIKELNELALKAGSCFGSSLYDAFSYLYIIGTNTLDCLPYNESLGTQYTFGNLANIEDEVEKIPLCTGVTGPLKDMCSDFFIDSETGEEFGTPAKFYRCSHFYTITPTEGRDLVKDIMTDIYLHGPVCTSIKLYPSFYEYDAVNEIYRPLVDELMDDNVVGMHAISIVGWGKRGSEGEKYWIMRNCWGSKWGDWGYFYVSRGN